MPWLISLGLICIFVGAYYAFPWLRTRMGRARRLGDWLNNPVAQPGWAIQAGSQCGSELFITPTIGYIGFIWGDSFRPGRSGLTIPI